MAASLRLSIIGRSCSDALPHPQRRPLALAGGTLLSLLALITGLGAPSPARAETVVERVARTGVLTLGGRTDLIPGSYVDANGQLVGVSLDVATRIAAELARYLNKPIRVDFRSVESPDALFKLVSQGEVDLACGVQFTWEREMYADYTLPYSLSGIRLLTRNASLNGSPEGLVGKRIGVLSGSLGEARIKDLQPKANLVPLNDLQSGVRSLLAGRLDAVAGDSLTLAGTLTAFTAGLPKGTTLDLVPREPLGRYGVGCILPENNSTFRNLANLAVAGLLQGYLDGEPAAAATVNRWFGPSGILQLPPELIRSFFESVLFSVERVGAPVRMAPAAQPNPQSPSAPR
jgi:polar amino acid transport system substrate-binding protein